jgi:hypothetical protein
METIQLMVSDGSPFVVLAQQGAEAANLIVVKKSADVPWREPSVDDKDRARHAQSAVVSSASPNRCLFEHDVRWCITQSRATREYDRDEMTCTTLLKIRGISGIELCPHRDGL